MNIFNTYLKKFYTPHPDSLKYATISFFGGLLSSYHLHKTVSLSPVQNTAATCLATSYLSQLAYEFRAPMLNKGKLFVVLGSAICLYGISEAAHQYSTASPSNESPIDPIFLINKLSIIHSIFHKIQLGTQFIVESTHRTIAPNNKSLVVPEIICL